VGPASAGRGRGTASSTVFSRPMTYGDATPAASTVADAEWIRGAQSSVGAVFGGRSTYERSALGRQEPVGAAVSIVRTGQEESRRG